MRMKEDHMLNGQLKPGYNIQVGTENNFVNGSEENYDYLEKKEFTGIVKYTTYEKETKRSFKKKTFNTENWKYDAEQKEYTCPCGNPVPYRKTVTKKNKSGYLQTYEVYQCENCEGCPFRELCTKSEYGRVIQRNGHWLEQKAKVKELLSSEEYKTLMKKLELNVKLSLVRQKAI
ncbi:transposase [Treponema sp.]|uniref:transposase n=1 Tax=Treponema sp. TaxID=166 RepID=UPI0039C6FC06